MTTATPMIQSGYGSTEAVNRGRVCLVAQNVLQITLLRYSKRPSRKSENELHIYGRGKHTNRPPSWYWLAFAVVHIDIFPKPPPGIILVESDVSMEIFRDDFSKPPKSYFGCECFSCFGEAGLGKSLACCYLVRVHSRTAIGLET